MPNARDTAAMRAAKITSAALAEPPALPPLSAEELKAADQEITAKLRQLAKDLRQRNLENAVCLAQQAAAGYGPLVEHFAELGRRYGHLLQAPPKPRLRLVRGGSK